jgi:hypothetical protein
VGATLPGTAAATTSTPSIRAATTVAHSGPGLGTSARRSRATPLSAAARTPRAGTPTIAHQEPEREASDSSASSSEVPPPAGAARPVATATVLPRRRPRPGSRPLSSGATGSIRCTPGSAVSPAARTSSARAAAPLIMRPAIVAPLRVACYVMPRSHAARHRPIPIRTTVEGPTCRPDPRTPGRHFRNARRPGRHRSRAAPPVGTPAALCAHLTARMADSQRDPRPEQSQQASKPTNGCDCDRGCGCNCDRDCGLRAASAASLRAAAAAWRLRPAAMLRA